MTVHQGSCHCGRVRFEVSAPSDLEVNECNCSICRMKGYLHLIVRRSDFRLLAGEAELTTYTFNTGVAQHYFCRHCGITPFYVPRSNPEGYSVNARCLDSAMVKSMRVESFDGQNWEANAGKLAHLTR